MESLHVDLYLRASPDDVWAALTDPQLVPRWRFGMSFQTDWQPGSPLSSRSPNGDGTVLQAVRGRGLVYEWSQTDQPQANGGHPSTVSFELTPMGEVTRLTVVHSDLESEGAFLKVVAPGWPMILSSLKSLIETGEPLSFQARS
ncbi:SRPBCC domain-containing protein [Nonomuraea turcica]|uniref:SRPBCC domain-containing protein n=1 Tax=Nonomuraea sp. G32 TaxID=3067274 RepID=UPI00273BE06C|nr:SRPBCC domain-containing protein [Nonomuraea sp. G32]MDP4503726.1 SRPBCC domain-containing protein [Nonomuraea sp. G32]